jgi:hypothetical protein
MSPTLLVLAAGLGSRYGGLKQLEPVGPHGETVMDYSVFDARRAGFSRVVFVIRRDFEEEFRRRVGARYAGQIAVDYVHQDLADLPDGFRVPPGRVKPWGTAHAVWSARHALDVPFAAINADDFYGRDAYTVLGRFLEDPPAGSPPFYAMVGYQLARTLSAHGSVARGVCVRSPDGLLRSVREMTKLVATAGGVENREDPAHPEKLTGLEPVSLNFWGFTPAFLPQVKERLIAFLHANDGAPSGECYIPRVVDELIAAGSSRVQLLETTSQWFGVTYREDLPHVVASIRRLVEAGEYPSPLWTG